MHTFVEQVLFFQNICEDFWFEEMTNYNGADKLELAGLSLVLLSHI